MTAEHRDGIITNLYKDKSTVQYKSLKIREANKQAVKLKHRTVNHFEASRFVETAKKNIEFNKARERGSNTTKSCSSLHQIKIIILKDVSSKCFKSIKKELLSRYSLL